MLILKQIKQKIKDSKNDFASRAASMGYFCDMEATDEIKEVYRIGALSALDEIRYFIDNLIMERLDAK